jgi:hypothetical protein
MCRSATGGPSAETAVPAAIQPIVYLPNDSFAGFFWVSKPELPLPRPRAKPMRMRRAGRASGAGPILPPLRWTPRRWRGRPAPQSSSTGPDPHEHYVSSGQPQLSLRPRTPVARIRRAASGCGGPTRSCPPTWRALAGPMRLVGQVVAWSSSPGRCLQGFPASRRSARRIDSGCWIKGAQVRAYLDGPETRPRTPRRARVELGKSGGGECWVGGRIPPKTAPCLAG